MGTFYSATVTKKVRAIRAVEVEYHESKTWDVLSVGELAFGAVSGVEQRAERYGSVYASNRTTAVPAATAKEKEKEEKEKEKERKKKKKAPAKKNENQGKQRRRRRLSYGEIEPGMEVDVRWPPIMGSFYPATVTKMMGKRANKVRCDFHSDDSHDLCVVGEKGCVYEKRE